MAKKKKPENSHSEQELPSEEGRPEAAEEGSATPAEPVPSLQEELEILRGTAAKNWDLYLRSQADLENFRKRAQRDREDVQRFANETILRETLPVLDNLERAVEHAGEAEAGSLLQGVQLTLTQLRKVLEKFGVTTFEAIGETFDPSRHEAIGQVESRQYPANTVAQQLQKGYLLNSRLLRPALVMIARPPAEEPPRVE